MQIQIPDEAKELILSQAKSAGFKNATDYMLNLVRQDQQCRAFTAAVASDRRVETLAQDGINSGPAIPLDIDAIRREYRERNSQSE